MRTVSCHYLKILITFEKLMSDYRSLITNNDTFQSNLFIDHRLTHSIDANIFKLTTLAHMNDVSEDDPCKEKTNLVFRHRTRHDHSVNRAERKKNHSNILILEN